MQTNFPCYANCREPFSTRWKCWRFLACLLLFEPFCDAFGSPKEIYIRLESFTWKEYSAGEQILKESGPRASVGVRGTWPVQSRIRLSARADGTFGRVDYDGATIGGEPAQDTTMYYGMRVECDVLPNATRSESSTFRAEPLIGLGTRWWVRRLAEGESDRGGYDEDWLMAYGRIGATIHQTFPSGDALYFTAAARPALYNTSRYSIRIEENESFRLEPGREWSWEVEAGVLRDRFRIAVFWETLSFGRSASKFFPLLEVYQPESDGRLVGLELGVRW